MSPHSRNNPPDDDVRQILDALRAYQFAHPRADIEAYRQNSVSVRIRIIDDDFHGSDRVDRDSEVWDLLAALPADVQTQVTTVLLLTQDEARTSFANVEFDHPVPSGL